MSVLTKVSLKTCVFKSITSKIDNAIINAYYNSGLMHIDIPSVFSHQFNPTKEMAEKYIADMQKDESSSESSSSESSEDDEGKNKKSKTKKEK